MTHFVPPSHRWRANCVDADTLEPIRHSQRRKVAVVTRRHTQEGRRRSRRPKGTFPVAQTQKVTSKDRKCRAGNESFSSLAAHRSQAIFSSRFSCYFSCLRAKAGLHPRQVVGLMQGQMKTNNARHVFGLWEEAVVPGRSSSQTWFKELKSTQKVPSTGDRTPDLLAYKKKNIWNAVHIASTRSKQIIIIDACKDSDLILHFRHFPLRENHQ